MEETREEMILLIRSYLFETFLLGFNENEFSNDESFYDVGVFDSIGILEVVTYIEQVFDIRFQENEVNPENISTINNIVDFITKKRSHKKSYFNNENAGW